MCWTFDYTIGVRTIILMRRTWTMKAFHGVMVFLGAIMLAGCVAGEPIRTNLYPSDVASGRSLFYTSVEHPKAFSSQPQAMLFEYCDFKLKPDWKPGEKYLFQNPEYWYTNCTPAEVAHDTSVSPGYIVGPMGVLVPSAAGAYAGHEIGRGLGKSGSITNTTVNGGNATGGNGVGYGGSSGGVINGNGGPK